jgi:putative FmdB family regulatory protein
MPTYEYRCRKCGKKFEKYQQITEPPVTSCPFCKGQVERLISGGSGLLFKGSGFYITDYRSDSYKKAAEKEKKSEKKDTSPAAKESGKSQTKTSPAS